MKQLKIRVLEKRYISFNRPNVSFLRDSQTTKQVSLNYTNGTGQTLTANQILYTSGTSGVAGFLEIKVLANYTLSNSGTIILVVTHYPATNAANTSISFTIDGSAVSVDVYYNSLPTASNIEIVRDNRISYTFSDLDFINNYQDYDGDTLAEIQLLGDLTGFTFNNNSIVSGTWISISDIAGGSLKYTPLDQDEYYEKIVDYKVKDINGNISIY